MDLQLKVRQQARLLVKQQIGMDRLFAFVMKVANNELTEAEATVLATELVGHPALLNHRMSKAQRSNR